MSRLTRILLVVASLGLPVTSLARPRVVVLGFDGADAALTQQMLDEGKLPNLARLRQQGVYLPLTSTNPPQTPVSWSTFATGLNPGRTNIFDFLKRDVSSSTPYVPILVLGEEGSREFLWGARNPWLGALLGLALGLLLVGGLLALLRPTRRLALPAGLLAGLVVAAAAHQAFARYLPTRVPIAINNRQGDTFWDLAAKAGLKTRIIRVPATFPATPVPGGEFLSGLGVPDIRGTVGTFSYYTTEKLSSAVDSEFGGKVIQLDPFETQTSSVIHGPRNRLFYKPDPRTHLDPEGDPAEILLPLLLTRADGKLAIEVSGQKLSISPGEWSDWVELSFPFNSLIKVKGIVRFHLNQLEPELKLFLSAVNLHPDHPPIPISSPEDYAWRLKQELGWYKTLGWAEETFSYTEKRIDEDTFFEDLEATVAQEEALMTRTLEKSDWDLYVQVFSFTDRVSHIFWRLIDRAHPAYDAKLAERFSGSIEAWYLRMDSIVGKALALTEKDPETVFLVCSDHGFATWHRAVNYNTWLVKNGYMTLYTSLGGRTLTLEDMFGNKGLFAYVDWSRTQAYALGLGNIYVNLKGREPQGSVASADYEAVVTGIQQGLEALVDPERGERPVRRVYRRDDIYSGFDPQVIPDLRVANNPGYRVSWQSSIGATPAEIFEDNKKPWSGDHCSLDPAAVPGILFANRRIARSDPYIADLMPTILRALGLEPPAGLDGKPLL